MFFVAKISIEVFFHFVVVMCGNSHGSIQLHPEALFTVPTDNIYMTSVCGTNNGRIFLAGKDSCLHEIVYKVSFVENRVLFTRRLNYAKLEQHIGILRCLHFLMLTIRLHLIS